MKATRPVADDDYKLKPCKRTNEPWDEVEGGLRESDGAIWFAALCSEFGTRVQGSAVSVWQPPAFFLLSSKRLLYRLMSWEQMVWCSTANEAKFRAAIGPSIDVLLRRIQNSRWVT